MAKRFDDSVTKVKSYIQGNPEFFKEARTIRNIFDTLKLRNQDLVNDLVNSFKDDIKRGGSESSLLEFLERNVGSKENPASDDLIQTAQATRKWKIQPPLPPEIDSFEVTFNPQNFQESQFSGLLGTNLKNFRSDPNIVGKYKLPESEIQNLFEKIKGADYGAADDYILSQYKNILSGIKTSGALDTAEAQKAEIDVLQDTISTSMRSREVARLEQEIPGLLESQRRAFFGEQRLQARDYVTGQIAPQIYQSLASRGLADSGEFGATVGAEFQSLMSEIEQKELAKEAEDINFWANQSYQNTLEDLIQAKQSVSQEIAETRQDITTKQQQSFAKSQADIQQRFALDLFRRENQRALDTYQRQLTQRESAQRKQREAGLFSDIFQAGATGIGLALTRGGGGAKAVT